MPETIAMIRARPLLLLPVALVLTGPAAAQSPGALDAPGDQPLAHLSAVGVQVYECRSGPDGQPAWAFKEPRADLSLAGRPVGRHYAGPTWEHEDGSRVVGRAAASLPAPRPGDIPWLRLTVVSRTGEGAFGAVTAVQRVATHGGTLAGRCDTPGAATEVPYTADYIMLRAAP